MNGSFGAGKALTWFIAVYHILLGGVLIVSGDLSIRIASLAHGWTIEGSPELGIAGEIVGCYVIAFGLMLAVAAIDPVKYRAFISVGIALIALRLLQRVVFADKVMATFDVAAGRYWGTFVWVLLLGVLLAVFRRQLGRAQAAA